ncbi:MAG: hypothetical protein RSF90_02035, partial [Pygmaiobacter sp.]
HPWPMAIFVAEPKTERQPRPARNTPRSTGAGTHLQRGTGTKPEQRSGRPGGKGGSKSGARSEQSFGKSGHGGTGKHRSYNRQG